MLMGRFLVYVTEVAAGREATWALPLYELALMTAARVAEHGLDVELSVVTPERAPLEIFGDSATSALAALLAERHIQLHSDCTPTSVGPDGLAVLSNDVDVIPAERVVGLPSLDGPHLPGLPADRAGFVPVDDRGLVEGEVDVYAAGDATTFPLKQGGLATQQADAVAAAVAARAGAPVTSRPFRPVLRGLLLTGGVPRYLRSESQAPGTPESEVAEHALWWPPSKIAGRYLSPYLALRGEELERGTAGPKALPMEVELEHRAGPGVRRRAIIASSGRHSRATVIPLVGNGK